MTVTNHFAPAGLATGIGSLPHTDPQAAVAAVLQYVDQCPFWPQLPKLSHLEGMAPQYAPGIPGLVEEGESERVDTEAGLEALGPFYEAVMAGEAWRFGLDPERARGFAPFEVALENGKAAGARYVKGHITGPVTMAAALKDGEGREITHNEPFREAVANHLAMNARWQVERLSQFGKPVIIFLDEPVMEVYGSAYSTLDRETVESLWVPVLEAIRVAGGLSGIHCCGNTDWGLLMECGTDIVNFDAYHFLDKFTLYADQAQLFMENGGALAWGVVPTDDNAWDETPERLLARIDEGMGRFAGQGVPLELLRRQCVITPSCGMGSLSVELTEKIFELLNGTSEMFRGRQADRRVGP